MPKPERLWERGLIAATAYLKRQGADVVEVDYLTPTGTIPIVAIEPGVALLLVRLTVTTESRPLSPPSSSSLSRYRQQERAYLEESDIGTSLPVRHDRINILVIEKDRALLRYERDIMRKEG